MPPVVAIPLAQILGGLSLSAALFLGIITQEQYNSLRGKGYDGSDVIRPDTPEYRELFGDPQAPATSAQVAKYEDIGNLSDNQKRLLNQSPEELIALVENKYAPETDQKFAADILKKQGYDVNFEKTQSGFNVGTVTGGPVTQTQTDILPAATPEAYTGGIDTSGYQNEISVDPGSDNKRVLDEYVGAGIYNEPTLGEDGRLTYTLNPEGARDNERRRNLLTWGEQVGPPRGAEQRGERALYQQSLAEQAQAESQAAGGRIREQFPGREQGLPYVDILPTAASTRAAEQFGERATYEQQQRDAAAAQAQAEAGQIREQFPGREQTLPYVSLLPTADATRAAEQRGERAAYEQSLRDAQAAEAQAQAGAIREQFPGREPSLPYVNILPTAAATRGAEQPGERAAYQQRQREQELANAQAAGGAIREQFPGREQSLPYVNLLPTADSTRQAEQFGERGRYEQDVRDAAGQAAGGAVTEQYPTRGQNPLVGTQYWNPAETGDANRGGEQRGERGRYIATLPETTEGGLIDAPSIVDREGDTLTTRSVQDILNAINTATTMAELDNAIASADLSDPAVAEAYAAAKARLAPIVGGESDAAKYLVSQAQERDAQEQQFATSEALEKGRQDSGQSQYHYDIYGPSAETIAASNKYAEPGGPSEPPGVPYYPPNTRDEQAAQDEIDRKAREDAERLKKMLQDKASLEAATRELAGRIGEQSAGKVIAKSLQKWGNALTDIATDPALAYSLALMNGQGFARAAAVYSTMSDTVAKRDARRQLEVANRRTVSQKLNTIPDDYTFSVDGQDVTWGDLKKESPELVSELTDMYLQNPDKFNEVMGQLGLSGGLGLTVDPATGRIGTPEVDLTDAQKFIQSLPSGAARQLAELRFSQGQDPKLSGGEFYNVPTADGRFGYDGVLDTKLVRNGEIKGERAASISQIQNIVNNEKSLNQLIAIAGNPDLVEYVAKAPGALSGVAPETAEALHTLDRMLYQKLRTETGAAISFKEFQNNKKQYIPQILGTDEYNQAKLVGAIQDSIATVDGFNAKLSKKALFLMKYGNQVKNFGSEDKVVQLDGATYIQKPDGSVYGPLN